MRIHHSLAGLTAMTVVAVMSGSADEPIRGGGREWTAAEKTAIADLEKRGCRIIVDEQQPGRPVIRADFKSWGFQRAALTPADLKPLREIRDLYGLTIRGHLISEPGLHWRNNEFTDAVLTELRELKSLQELDIAEIMVPDARLADVGAVSSLRKLRLGWVGTDAGIKHLKGLKNLQELDLRGTHITDRGLKELLPLENLQVLAVHGDNAGSVTDAGLKELKPLKNLRTLILAQAGDETFQAIAELRQLRELQIDSAHIQPEALAGLGHLEVLVLRGLGAREGGLDACLAAFKGLKNLQRLELGVGEYSTSPVPFTEANLREFKHLENLRELSLSGPALTSQLIEDLKAVKNLTKVALLRGVATEAGLKKLRDLNGLERLELHPHVEITANGIQNDKYRINDASLRAIDELKELQELDLSATDVTDAGLMVLRGWKNLRKLRLPLHGNITDAGLKAIAELRNLQELELDTRHFYPSDKVTDAGVKELKELTELRKLWLTAGRVTDAGLREIADLKNLQELRLSIQLTDAGLKELRRLKNLRVLELSLSSPWITDTTVRELKELKSVHTLILWAGVLEPDNRDETGFKKYCEGLAKLKELSNLEELRLEADDTVRDSAEIAELQKALPRLRIRY